jgi:hypothetical protein
MKKILLVLLLVGCADVRPDSKTITTHELDSNTIDAHYKNVDVDCIKETCQSKKQYCLRSTRDFESNLFLTSTCLDRPLDCGDCTCMRKDAQRRFKGAKNCKADIHCSQDDSKIIVTCVAPQE